MNTGRCSHAFEWDSLASFPAALGRMGRIRQLALNRFVILLVQYKLRGFVEGRGAKRWTSKVCGAESEIPLSSLTWIIC